MYIPEYARITTGLGKLTPEVMSRIGQATEKTLGEVVRVDQKAENVDRDTAKYFTVGTSSWIKKINNIECVWVYVLAPCAFSVSNAAFVSPSAVGVVDGSAGSSIIGFNFIEWGTNATTVAPGVDWADIPAGFAVQPIAPGTVVICNPVRIVVGAIPVVPGASFVSAWGFSVVNAISGTC